MHPGEYQTANKINFEHFFALPQQRIPCSDREKRDHKLSKNRKRVFEFVLYLEKLLYCHPGY